MKNISKILIVLFAAALGSFGQALLPTVTLGAAITSTSQTTITLSSTSGMLNPGPVNQINTVLYVDREFMWVQQVVNSTTVVVQRGKGIGAGAKPALHANSALVYYQNTQTIGSVVQPAATFFGNSQPTGEVSGACTATNEKVLPLIYLFSGNIYDCKNGSSGGQWILTGNGTMGASPGIAVSAFCTGTVGSSQTEYLYSAACSGATTNNPVYTVQRYGTLANLQVTSTAAVVGGSNVDVATVYLNGSATTLTCTIAASGTTCSDGIGSVSGHSVAVAPGNTIAFKFVTAGSDTAAGMQMSVGIF